MISGPLAHVGGLPIEETLGSFGPALLVGFAVTWANVRARLRRVRFRASPHQAASGPAAAVHLPPRPFGAPPAPQARWPARDPVLTLSLGPTDGSEAADVGGTRCVLALR